MCLLRHFMKTFYFRKKELPVAMILERKMGWRRKRRKIRKAFALYQVVTSQAIFKHFINRPVIQSQLKIISYCKKI